MPLEGVAATDSAPASSPTPPAPASTSFGARLGRLPLLARAVALAVLLPLGGLMLMVLADLVPDRLVMDELYEAVTTGSLDAEPYGIGYTGRQVDEWSECKRITIGLGDPPGTGPIESAVRSPTLGFCPTAVGSIVGWAEGEGLTSAYDYFRYWNGSAAVFRPSIALLGVDGTRMLAAMSLVAALGWLLWELRRRVGRLATALFAVPLVASTDFIDLPGALVQAVGMVVLLSSAAALLRWLPRDVGPGSVALATFAAGAVFLFFGDLTNPDAAWTLAVVSAGLVAAGTGPWPRVARTTVAAAAGWIAGFAWMWFTKWVISAVVIGYDTVRTVITFQVEARLDGEQPGFDGSPIEGIRRSWTEWWAQPVTTLVVVGCVAVAVGVVVARTRRGEPGRWSTRAVLAAPVVIPIVWHAVLRSHTYIHAFFAYRSFAVAFGVLLLAVTARFAGAAAATRREPVDSAADAAVDAAGRDEVVVAPPSSA